MQVCWSNGSAAGGDFARPDGEGGKPLERTGSSPTLPGQTAWRSAPRDEPARGTAPREAATERMLCGDGMPRSAFARRCGPPSLGAAGAAFFHFFFYFFSCFFF